MAKSKEEILSDIDKIDASLKVSLENVEGERSSRADIVRLTYNPMLDIVKALREIAESL